MRYSDTESREGAYDIYYTPEGQRLIVLEGLDPDEQVVHYPMQKFFSTHLDTMIVFYWLLLLAVSVYLLSLYIIEPLLHAYRRRSHNHG